MVPPWRMASLQDAPGILQDPAPILEGEAPGRGGGVEPGGKEDFAGVDVADAGQDPAVQQEIFNGPGTAPGLIRQPPGGHLPGERLPAHLLQRGRRRPRREDQHLAEAPDVLIDEFQAVIQVENQVDVIQLRQGFGLRAQEQMAGHPQMHQQGDAALQGKDQVFAPAAEVRKFPAQQPMLQLPERTTGAAGTFPPRSPGRSGVPPTGGPDPGGRPLPREVQAY